MPPQTPQATLARHCYDAAIAASAPAPLIRAAMRGLEWNDRPASLIAIGKAAPALAAGALADGRDTHFCGGLLVSGNTEGGAPDSMSHWTGDHPVPRAQSLAASNALGHFVNTLPVNAAVHLLISGGASAMIGAPLPGCRPEELEQLFEALLGAGLAIDEMNAVRKRFARWSAGRLAAALMPRPVHLWLLSDVPGDDPATIASGPCHPDPWTSAEVEGVLRRVGLWDGLPAAARSLVLTETLKEGAAPFAQVRTTVIGNNHSAILGVVAEAARQGAPQRTLLSPLRGEASDAGRRIAAEVIRVAGEWETQNQLLAADGGEEWIRPLVLFQGGETSVTLGATPGRGGRSQELALAAAEMLEVSPWPVTLLAAGTDGRDGATDAAGAMVDENTWAAIGTAGRDPGALLVAHDAYPALDSVGALIRTGDTGSNVMDLLIAVVGPAREAQLPASPRTATP